MIQAVTTDNLSALAQLAQLLWPHHPREELQEEFANILAAGEAQCFLKYCDGIPVGFAQCQLRHDYVEGTDSSPVGYLEGIFVRAEYRRRGFARQLLSACQGWAKDRGCREFASDCELDNLDSLRFHLAVGFLEANRIICFTKKLED